MISNFLQLRRRADFSRQQAIDSGCWLTQFSSDTTWRQHPIHRFEIHYHSLLPQVLDAGHRWLYPHSDQPASCTPGLCHPSPGLIKVREQLAELEDTLTHAYCSPIMDVTKDTGEDAQGRVWEKECEPSTPSSGALAARNLCVQLSELCPFRFL